MFIIHTKNSFKCSWHISQIYLLILIVYIGHVGYDIHDVLFFQPEPLG